MQFTLIGGGGAVGQELVPVLKRAGHKVRVLGREAAKLRKIFANDDAVECESLDLEDKAQTAHALRGTDVIVYLIGVPYSNFELHPKLTRLALDAAKTANVPYFVHVSTVYPYGVPQENPVTEDHPRNPPSFKGRMRKEQEDLVLAAHDASGMQCLIVRPPDFYGPTAENSYVADVFAGALANRPATVVAPVDTLHEFIYIPDLAEAVFQLAVQPAAFGQVYNITGPGPLTTQEFADKVYGQVGLPTKLRKGGKWLLWLLGWWDPNVSQVVEIHYLWTTPILLDDSKALAILPHLKKTPHDEAIRLTLERLRSKATV